MATRSGGSRSGKSSGSRSGTKRGAGGGQTSSARRSAATARGDKSVEAFRDALERSVTLSRDRLQEVMDDAVKRGRMTRDDANELVSSLLTRGRHYTDDLVKELERLLDQARRELGSRTAPDAPPRHQGRRPSRAGGARTPRTRPWPRPIACAAGRGSPPAGPITAYDQLTASQIKSRLDDLSAAELRELRTREKRGKARKGVLAEIDRRLR